MTVFKPTLFKTLALGLLALGVSQRLLMLGVVSPWARDKVFPLVLLVLGLICGLGGALLLLPLVVQFYKTHRSDKRLVISLGAYLLATVISGLLIGGLGQVLYDQTSWSYDQVKTGIWLVSSLVQLALKLLFAFSLVSIYRHQPIRRRLRLLVLPVLGALVVLLLTLVISLWWSSLGTWLVSLTDAGLLLAMLYYLIYMMKETSREKTS